MRAGILAMVFVAALSRASTAQQLPPLPPGHAALSVPHPIPPISTSPEPPRDLYQHQRLTPPPRMFPALVYPSGFYGPYGGAYGPFGPAMYLGPGYAAGTEPLAKPASVSGTAQGGLRLESSPSSAQVYVDGAYVGMVDDFGDSGRALDLDEGRHRVELRAAGYATLSFEIDIAVNRTTRYRGDLQQLPALAPAATSVAAAPAAMMPPKTTYVIPNCYAGDRPPSRALPLGCDVSKMLVREP